MQLCSPESRPIQNAENAIAIAICDYASREEHQVADPIPSGRSPVAQSETSLARPSRSSTAEEGISKQEPVPGSKRGIQ
jgi:hypothetical protein